MNIEQLSLFPQETTAIYPNRIVDKQKVEAAMGLPEAGNPHQLFFTPKKVPFARGYIRIVYGDHGPYVEFSPSQICIPLQKKFDRPLPKQSFYEWVYPLGEPEVKVYNQKRAVTHLKNPPEGGFKGERGEGYADYKPGFIYVSPWDLTI